jgi:hypothetical protein
VTVRRVAFEATTMMSRHDFGVSLARPPAVRCCGERQRPRRVDVGAILEEDLERTGAVESYR